jgi:outer membrane protein assembly factor BamA
MRLFSTAIILLLSTINVFAGIRWLPKTVHVRHIHIEGNHKTQEQTILRELVYKSGQIMLRPQGFARQQSINALVNLNLFNHIDIQTSFVGKDTIDVTVIVREKWYTWPLPFLEFADRNFNQWYDFDFSPDRTNYGLYFFKYNNFGRNQTLKLSLVTGYTDILGFEYRIPYFPKFPKLGLEVHSSFKRNHEIWFTSKRDQLQFLKYNNLDMIRQFKTGLKLIYRLSASQDFISIESRYDHVEVHDIVRISNIYPSYLVNNERDNWFLTTAVRLTSERRNNKLFPTSGHYSSLNLKHRLHEGAFYNFSINLKHTTHLRVADNGHIGLSFDAYHTNISNPSYYVLPALGYQHLVRGFEDYVITGESFGLIKTHYKHKIYSKEHRIKAMPLKAYKTLPLEIYASTHFDGGYMDNPKLDPQNTLQNSLLFGYGVGVDLLFYMEKLLRIEYSFTNKQTQGVYVHFKKAF